MIDAEYRFIVINSKHLRYVPEVLTDNLIKALEDIQEFIPKNKYLVVNQDESYAEEVWKLIQG